MKLSVRSRPALARCNKVRLCLAIPSKYHLLVTILLYPGLGQGSELSDQQDEKNNQVNPVILSNMAELLKIGDVPILLTYAG